LALTLQQPVEAVGVTDIPANDRRVLIGAVLG
jgi:hypothetical protein